MSENEHRKTQRTHLDALSLFERLENPENPDRYAILEFLAEGTIIFHPLQQPERQRGER